MYEGRCVTCKKAWCDNHNQCSSKCHGNCKTKKEERKNAQKNSKSIGAVIY